MAQRGQSQPQGSNLAGGRGSYTAPVQNQNYDLSDLQYDLSDLSSPAGPAPKAPPAKGIDTEAEARNEYSKTLPAWSPELLGLSFADLRDKAAEFGSSALSGLKTLADPSTGSRMAAAALKDPTKIVTEPAKMVAGAVKGITSPAIKTADVAFGNETPESAREKLSGAAVDFVTQTAPAVYGAKNLAGGKFVNPEKAAERMTRFSKKGSGAEGAERVNLEGTMETTLREKGTPPIKQTGADRHVMENLTQANTELDNVAAAVPQETTIPKAYLREAYQRAIGSLDPTNPDHAAALKKLEWEASKIESLPDQGNFHQTHALKRVLDKEIATAKKNAFTETVQGAPFATEVREGLVNNLRGLLSEFAPNKAAWDRANDLFHSWKARAEIVERQRPEVLAAAKKGLEAQTEKAGGRVTYADDSAVPAAAAGAGKAAMGMSRSAAVEGGRLLGKQLRTVHRAIARGNEKLLKLSGREYGEFYPPEVKPPSALIEEVRKNQAGLSPEQVLGVPAAAAGPLPGPSGTGYVKMGGFEYPENYAANLDIPSPSTPQQFNQRVQAPGPGVEEINAIGTKPFAGAPTQFPKTSGIGGYDPPIERGLTPSMEDIAYQPHTPEAFIEEPRTGQLSGMQETLPGATPLRTQMEGIGTKGASTEPFYEGLSGRKREQVPYEPVVGEKGTTISEGGTETVNRDYRNQPGLFEINQTPIKWNPTMRETSMTTDLQAMLSEIENYVRANPNKAGEWMPDIEALRNEISRRKEALGARGRGTPE